MCTLNPEQKNSGKYEWSALSYIYISDPLERRRCLRSSLDGIVLWCAKRCVRIILSPQRYVIKSGRAFCAFFLGYCLPVDGRWWESARAWINAAKIFISLFCSKQRRSYIMRLSAETRPCKQCELRIQSCTSVCVRGATKALENYLSAALVICNCKYIVCNISNRIYYLIIINLWRIAHQLLHFHKIK
jgi:hypothetical protein